MRVVITGGAGFVGSHLCERFLRDNHEVVCLDNYITGSPRNVEHLLDHPSFTLTECDVSEQLDVDGSVDAILHFASPASPIDYLNHPIETMKVGAHATLNCLDLARQYNARVLFASTSEIYGDPLQHPQQEGYFGNVNSIGPRSVYDEAKRFGEAAMMAYNRQYGLPTRIVRIFNTYGPRMQADDGRVLPAFFSQALRGEPITVFGDGSQTRSFCYVSDLVEGICRLLASDYTLPVNLGNPAEITIRQLVDEIIDLTGSSSTVTYRDLPQDDPKLRRPDISRAQEVLGWEPKVSRREGLAILHDYFKSTLVCNK